MFDIETLIREQLTFDNLVYQLRQGKMRISLFDFDRWIVERDKFPQRIELLLNLHDNSLLLDEIDNKTLKVLRKSLKTT